MAWGVKRTKLEEMLDEKRQEVASLSPQQGTGRLRQLEREIRYLESMLRVDGAPGSPTQELQTHGPSKP
jgi:hypothetical protein